MMPGMPLPLGLTRFYASVQCTCGGAMYYGRDAEDLCGPGEMTCSNTECSNFGAAYVAPTVDVKQTGGAAPGTQTRQNAAHRSRFLLNEPDPVNGIKANDTHPKYRGKKQE